MIKLSTVLICSIGHKRVQLHVREQVPLSYVSSTLLETRHSTSLSHLYTLTCGLIVNAKRLYAAPCISTV